MEMFITSFAQVPDPRAGNARHDLVELLFNAFVAVLCGAKTCFEMAEFGRAKTSFFKNVLGLAHGVPSYDTFSTVFRMLAPKAFGATLAPPSERCEVVVIDEKAVKHVYEAGKAHAPKMMASAFAAELRMTLSCLAAKDGDEVSAALEVLGFVDLTGKIVTADARHCHRRMADGVVARGGDYCLALKGNQDSLHSDAGACFLKIKTTHPTAETTARPWSHRNVTRDRRHCRRSRRLSPVSRAHRLRPYRKRPLCRRQSPDREPLLDVVVAEDAASNRKDHGPQNLAVLRRLVLNVARADKTKGSLAGKLRRAAWDEDYLVNLLAQTRQPLDLAD